MQKIIEIFQHLDVGIKIYAAVIIESESADVVGREGIFTIVESVVDPF